jgi:hypothetical protein
MIEAINNSNRNTVLYTAGSAVVGGGAAATYGFLSKPYIKNGIPTDSFCDSFISAVRKENPEMTNMVDGVYQTLKSINSTEDLKTIAKAGEAFILNNIDDNVFAQIKAVAGQAQEAVAKTGTSSEILEKVIKEISEAESPEQLRGLVSKIIDKGLDLVKIDSLKKLISDFEANSKIFKKALVTGAWFASVDKDGKLVSEEVSPAVKFIKSAAKSVQLKTAGIYGAIGAAVAGTIGYFAGKTDKA